MRIERVRQSVRGERRRKRGQEKERNREKVTERIKKIK